jgi:hypothetical protein
VLSADVTPMAGPVARSARPDHGPYPALTLPLVPTIPPVPTAPLGDVEIVREVRAAAIQAGIYRDPGPEFVRVNPGWTRERWDRAWEAGLGLGGAPR